VQPDFARLLAGFETAAMGAHDPLDNSKAKPCAIAAGMIGAAVALG
jgi:hypothetical protein